MDSTPSDRTDANRDTGPHRMMAHKNTVLHGILEGFPWPAFGTLVEQHGSDKHVRTLPTKAQFIALVIAQLSGICGLRAAVTVVNSYAAQLYHLGGSVVKRSTLSDANALRPSAVFETLFARMAALAHRSLRQDLNDLVFLIDSTSLKLNEYSAGWARFSAKVCGAKLHVIYDPDADQPIYAAFSAANVNDITAAQEMPIVAGATDVFDLGYYHFRWWLTLHGQQCRFVTRLKTFTKLTVTRERLVQPGLPVLSDRIGYLPGRQANSRRNPFQDEVRGPCPSRHWHYPAHSDQRPEGPSAGDRRSLQAALGDRIVFPLDQANLGDPLVHGRLRERRPHPGVHRADRFSAQTHGTCQPDGGDQPAGVQPVAARSSHELPRYRRPQTPAMPHEASRRAAPARDAATGQTERRRAGAECLANRRCSGNCRRTKASTGIDSYNSLHQKLNRTAVGLTRGPPFAQTVR